MKAPHERALALHESQQRSPARAIVAASPARAAGEDENFAPGERHGSYAYGSLYFEETRLRSRYMLCRGEPGACPPEEVMANLCDEFGLPNPQMIFFGLGANGRWNTGFATLDVFASKLINQVRSSGPFRSEARLGSVEDERAATALNDWGTLSDLDLTIIDNALIEHFFDDDDDPHAPDVDADLAARLRGKRDEVFQFGFALRRYAVAAKDVLHEIGQFDFNDAASSKSGKADLWTEPNRPLGPVEKDCRVLVWDGAERRLGTVREVHETTLAAAPAAAAAPAGAPASEAAVTALRKTVTVKLDDKLDAGGAERKYDAARVHHVRGSMRRLLTQCLKDLAKRIYDTTLRRGQCLTKEGLRAYEEYLHEAKCGGRRAPTTERELKRRYLDGALKAIKDARNRKKRDAARATAARGLRRYTSALEGDPVALAQGLAHEFSLAESAVFKPGAAKGDHAPPQAEIERLVVEAAHIVVYAENEGHEGKKLRNSLEAMRNAWNVLEDALEAVAEVDTEDHLDEGAEAFGVVGQLVARFYYRRQRERAKALYRIRKKKYEHVCSAYMASVVQASYESRGWLVSELSSRCSYNQSPVMFEGGVQRFAQSYSMSDLTYLGLYTTSYARDNRANLEALPGLKDLKDSEAPALAEDMTVRFDGGGDGPFTLYTPKGEFDLARHARPTAAEATEPVVYPYYQASEPATTVTEAERQRRRVWKGVQELEREWPPVDAAMTLRAETKCLRACDSRAKVKTLNRYLRADLSPFCTHLIFFEHESDRLNFKAYLQRFLPHATTVPCRVEISEFGYRSDAVTPSNGGSYGAKPDI